MSQQELITLTGVKGFQGMEGRGLNATLVFKGRKAAFVLDDAHGGEMNVDWVRTWPNVEAEVLAYCRTLPMPEWSKEFSDYKDDTGYKRLHDLISKLADDYENDKRLKRMCAKKTVIETAASKAKNQFITYNVPYSPKAVEFVKAKHPDAVFLNERFAPKDAKGKAFARIAAVMAETR